MLASTSSFVVRGLSVPLETSSISLSSSVKNNSSTDSVVVSAVSVPESWEEGSNIFHVPRL